MVPCFVSCDHPGCDAFGPKVPYEDTIERTVVAARSLALDAGWQRWREPDGRLLDLCPEHRRAIHYKATTYR